MLHKTKGIVFKTTAYSESSVIAQIFTEKFGLQSYLINGVRKTGGKFNMNMFQPLHLLDMVVYHKPTGNIQRAAELRNFPVFESIPYHIVKSSLVIFLNEVIYKSIRLHTADERLFKFLFHSLEALDHLDEGLGNFHLWFMVQMSRYLGFYPDISHRELPYFDLRDGTYAEHLPVHVHVLEGSLTVLFTQLATSHLDTISGIQLTHAQRKDLLDKLLEYYQLHVDGFINIKSHIVLEEVLRD